MKSVRSVNPVLLMRRAVRDRNDKGVTTSTMGELERISQSGEGVQEEFYLLGLKIVRALDNWKAAEAISLLPEYGMHCLVEGGAFNWFKSILGRMQDMVEGKFELPTSPYAGQAILICQALREYGYSTLESELTHLAALSAQGHEVQFMELLELMEGQYPGHPQVKAHRAALNSNEGGCHGTHKAS